MNTLKMIAEIKTTCGTLEAERNELMTRVKAIDDRLTGFRMAIESLEMTIGTEKKAESSAPAVTPAVKEKKLGNNGREWKTLEFNGERKTIREWSKALGISEKTIYYRLNKGWPVKDVLGGKFSRKKTKKATKIFAYDANGNTVRQYVNLSAAARDLKLPESTVKATIVNVSKADQLKSRGYYLAYTK